MHIRELLPKALLTTPDYWAYGGYDYHHYSKTSKPITYSTPTSVSSTANPTFPSSSSTSVPDTTVSSTANPTQPSSSTKMRSTRTLITTTVLTVTTLVTPTVSVSQDPPAIFGPIEGLPQCAQTIIFDRLTNSECNPANFPCICDELARLQVGEAIRGACPAPDLQRYDEFVASICPNNRRPTSIIIPVNTTTVVSTAALPINTGSAPVPNVTTTEVAPFNNGTVTSAAPINTDTGTGVPSLTTTDVLIPTTDANGQLTTLTSQVVGPVNPGAPTGPPGPDFTGAAAAVEVPEMFGSPRVGLMAGAIGIMGLVFAEL